MALTAAGFMRDRKEFRSAGAQLVASTIVLAAQQVSSAEYGDAYDQALSLKTAELLWESPFGVSMRRDGDSTENPYAAQLAKLQIQRIPRIVVL